MRGEAAGQVYVCAQSFGFLRLRFPATPLPRVDRHLSQRISLFCPIVYSAWPRPLLSVGVGGGRLKDGREFRRRPCDAG